MGTTAAVAAVLSALTAAGTTAYSMSKGTPSTKMPTPKPVDMSAISKGLLPGAKADAAARVGGGMSPDFLSSLIDQQSGSPGGAGGILTQIRDSLGQGGLDTSGLNLPGGVGGIQTP